MRKKRIYLDYAASTPVDAKVLKAMLPYLKGEYGNPSSVHAFGQRARSAVEAAREQAAKFLSCSANEIVFTSGATEANNLAIQGIARLTTNDQRPTAKPHIITSAIEHESVLAPIQQLEKEGTAEVSCLSVGKEGIVNLADVEKAVKKNTALVSIQYANSEIGTIQPIAEIGKIIKKRNESSVVGRRSLVVFHTDAVQAANYLSCNVEKLGVDLLTLSSHKLYGPKGVGVLYVRKRVSLYPLAVGGGQEQGRRPGTENIAGIAGMGEAVAALSDPRGALRNIKMRQLRDWFFKEAQKRIPGIQVAGSVKERVPNNTHLLFRGISGKDLVFLLDQKGVAVSAGSACSELTQEPSHVLLAMGYAKKEAEGALRITLGKHTTRQELEKTLKVLKKAVEQLAAKK